MDINCLGSVVLCVSGLLYFHNVFGETENSESMLNDIRNELNKLKLSNERNERKIMRFENQVNGCHRKCNKLSKRVTVFEHFEQRLDAIEYKVESRDQKLFERLNKSCNNGRTKDCRMTADDESARDAMNKRDIDVKDEKVADVQGVDEGNGSVKQELNVDVNGLKNELQGRESLINKRIVPVTSRPMTNTNVAFSAYMNSGFIGLIPGGVAPFDHVHLNEGQAFNTISHIFTCPLNGIYYFASSVVAGTLQNALTKIMRNGLELAVMYSVADNSKNERGFDQGFNSIVTVCIKGERVWVESYDSGDVYGDTFATFNGFLVSEL